MLFSQKAADDTDRIRVKICGLTREDDVVTAIEAGADAVGFVCYPGSSRYVTPSRLMALTSLVPESVSIVLVFVNPTSEEVREHLAEVAGDLIEFREDPEAAQFRESQQLAEQGLTESAHPDAEAIADGLGE